MIKHWHACLLMVSALSLFSPGISLGEETTSADSSEDLSALVDKLFSEELGTTEAFESSLAEADLLGATPQVLLEARLSWHWKRAEFGELVTLLPAMEKHLEAWNFETSRTFRDANELYGYYNLFRALEAKENKNDADFEKFAKESFWKNPELGPLLTFLITEHRKAEVGETLRLPMDLPLFTSQGKKVTLAELVRDKKGVLLDFWATWCGPCMALMPELVKKAKKLEPQGLVVAGMNFSETMTEAENFRKERKIDFSWLVEPEGQPFSKILAIDSIPRMILVNPSGLVLFNGHPMDPTLNDALAKLDVAL